MFELIQAKVKVGKNKDNNFGGYKYRSASDILEVAKPIMAEHGCQLILSDTIVQVGERYYIKAEAVVTKDKEEIARADGWAREPENRKGMDSSQITGSTSSYARKYALAGLFALDDETDIDSLEAPEQSAPSDDDKPWFNDDDLKQYRGSMISKIQAGETDAAQIIRNLSKQYKLSKKMRAEISELDGATS
jgi:hypothetical protein